VFFFQAEDGIRDFHVTGVQTCALPIYEAEVAERQEQRRARPDDEAHPAFPGHPPEPAAFRLRDPRMPFAGHRAEPLLHAGKELRSEERRGGKECRSRWSQCPYRTSRDE